MNKKVASAFLLTIFAITTASAWLFAHIGAGALVGIGYFLGIQKVEDLEQQIAYYQDLWF